MPADVGEIFEINFVDTPRTIEANATGVSGATLPSGSLQLQFHREALVILRQRAKRLPPEAGQDGAELQPIRDDDYLLKWEVVARIELNEATARQLLRVLQQQLGPDVRQSST